jgi:hypothetical protein
LTKKLVGVPLEIWVFVAIFALAGFLVILCGLNHAELNLVFVTTGLAIISLGSLALNKKIKEWLKNI